MASAAPPSPPPYCPSDSRSRSAEGGVGRARAGPERAVSLRAQPLHPWEIPNEPHRIPCLNRRSGTSRSAGSRSRPRTCARPRPTRPLEIPAPGVHRRARAAQEPRRPPRRAGHGRRRALRRRGRRTPPRRALQRARRERHAARRSPRALQDRRRTAIRKRALACRERGAHLPMHPADQVVAFSEPRRVPAPPSPPSPHASGSPSALVEQRLRLGNAAPELLDAYRAEAIDLETLKAFAVTTDHDAPAWRLGAGLEPGLPAVRVAGEANADRGAGPGRHRDRTIRRRRRLRGRRWSGPARPLRRRVRERRVAGESEAPERPRASPSSRPPPTSSPPAGSGREAVHSRSSGAPPRATGASIPCRARRRTRRPPRSSAFAPATTSSPPWKNMSGLTSWAPRPRPSTSVPRTRSRPRRSTPARRFRAEDFAMAGCIATVGRDGSLQVIQGLVKPEDMPKETGAGYEWPAMPVTATTTARPIPAASTAPPSQRPPRIARRPAREGPRRRRRRHRARRRSAGHPHRAGEGASRERLRRRVRPRGVPDGARGVRPRLHRILARARHRLQRDRRPADQPDERRGLRRLESGRGDARRLVAPAVRVDGG